MRRSIASAVLLLLLSLLVVPACYGVQDAKASTALDELSITGIVKNTHGKPVKDAAVRLRAHFQINDGFFFRSVAGRQGSQQKK
jgi:hypothetical protein